MALARFAGGSLLLGAAAMLTRRALRRPADWYDEPLPDQEDDLVRGLIAGRMTGAAYREEMERLAAEGERGWPLGLPRGWEA